MAATASNAPIFPNVIASAAAIVGAIQYFAPNYGNPKIHQADLIFERELMRNTTVSASYLLSLGRNLPSFIDRNLNAPNQTQLYRFVNGPFDKQTFTLPVFRGVRPNTSYAQMTEAASTVKSEYHALVLQANRRFSNGLQLVASYTLSKAVDDNQTSTTFTANNTLFNVFDSSLDRGRSNFDRRHKFVASAVYAPRVKAGNHAATALFDGWQIAPILQIYTGLPYDSNVSGSLPASSPANAAIPNATVSGINGSGGVNRLPLLGRNAFTGTKVVNVDLRLSKRFYLKEKVSMEILGEAFNVFNRTQITGINSTFYALSGTAQDAVLTYQSDFGTVSEAGATLYRERQIQIGARFRF